MKNILLGLLVLSTSAFADVNGSIGYSSDYMWRGVSQSAGASSLNAGIELDSNGFFVPLSTCLTVFPNLTGITFLHMIF